MNLKQCYYGAGLLAAAMVFPVSNYISNTIRLNRPLQELKQEFIQVAEGPRKFRTLGYDNEANPISVYDYGGQLDALKDKKNVFCEANHVRSPDWGVNGYGVHTGLALPGLEGFLGPQEVDTSVLELSKK